MQEADQKLHGAADRFEPNQVSTVWQKGELGKTLTTAIFTRLDVVGNVGVLPDRQRASAVLSGFLTAGTVTGKVIPVAGAPAATFQVGVDAVGNLLFFGADAVTEAEVTIVTYVGAIHVIKDAPVTTNTLLISPRGTVLLSITGADGTVGTLQPRGTAQGANTDYQLSADGSSVIFGTNSTVTVATARYISPVPYPGEALLDFFPSRESR